MKIIIINEKKRKENGNRDFAFKFSEWRDSGNEIRLFIAIGETMTL